MGFCALNSKTYYENEKTVSIPSKTSTRIYSHTLSGGIYLVRCNVAFSTGAAVLTALNIKNVTEGKRSLTVRGNMESGGGLYLEATIDARERDITVDISVYQGYTTAVQAYCEYSYIKL